jgi:hypothetical protein
LHHAIGVLHMQLLDAPIAAYLSGQQFQPSQVALLDLEILGDDIERRQVLVGASDTRLGRSRFGYGEGIEAPGHLAVILPVRAVCRLPGDIPA